MGISSKVVIPKVEDILSKINKDSITMIELGNQHIDHNPGGIGTPAKPFYESKGINHISIDKNGKDGAIALDLSKDIPVVYEGGCDILTNHGTTEHIPNQETVFKNIHGMCAEGGYMIHQVPIPKTWHGHCIFYYDLKFFDELASMNGYEVIENRLLNEGMYVGNRAMIWCVLRKLKNSDYVGIPYIIDEKGNKI